GLIGLPHGKAEAVACGVNGVPEPVRRNVLACCQVLNILSTLISRFDNRQGRRRPVTVPGKPVAEIAGKRDAAKQTKTHFFCRPSRPAFFIAGASALDESMENHWRHEIPPGPR